MSETKPQVDKEQTCIVLKLSLLNSKVLLTDLPCFVRRWAVTRVNPEHQ